MTDERGFTLVELLVAAALMIVVLGATLTAFERFQFNERDTQTTNDLQDRARDALDRASRELRNGASPAKDKANGIDKATPTDLVFQIVDPTPTSGTNVRNVQRVRYCLDTSVPNDEKLWRQWTQPWAGGTPAAPSTATCPDPDSQWAGQQLLVSNVTNYALGQSRPVFCPTPGAQCPGSSAAPPANEAAMTRVQMRLFVDNDVNKLPRETSLRTGIFFRNQSQAPVAAFTWTESGGDLYLNASDSYSPYGGQLTYSWDDGGTNLGGGQTNNELSPTPGAHTITLTVTDGSGLSAQTSQVVNIQ